MAPKGLWAAMQPLLLRLLRLPPFRAGSGAQIYALRHAGRMNRMLRRACQNRACPVAVAGGAALRLPVAERSPAILHLLYSRFPQPRVHPAARTWAVHPPDFPELALPRLPSLQSLSALRLPIRPLIVPGAALLCVYVRVSVFPARLLIPAAARLRLLPMSHRPALAPRFSAYAHAF